MKFLLFLTFFASQSWAVPVLNQNMAAEGTFVTIWPDHQNPDHFYFAPNFMKIASDKKGAPKFHFTQYQSGRCGRLGGALGKCHSKALISTLMVAGFDLDQLNTAQEGIRKIRPNARFSAIPFLSSEVNFGETLNSFIDKHECAPKAGQAADEIPCTITFNRSGINKLMPFLSKGHILPFKFIYRISGVIEDGNGNYESKMLDYGLTVNLGGEGLINHPDLIENFIWEE